jgi:hypothetical protein
VSHTLLVLSHASLISALSQCVPASVCVALRRPHVAPHRSFFAHVLPVVKRVRASRALLSQLPHTVWRGVSTSAVDASVIRTACRGTRPISLLFDGTAVMRASWTAGKELAHHQLPDGSPAGSLYHFAKTMLRILDSLTGTHIAFVVDRHSARKRAIHPEYKRQHVSAARIGLTVVMPWEGQDEQVCSCVHQLRQLMRRVDVCVTTSLPLCALVSKVCGWQPAVPVPVTVPVTVARAVSERGCTHLYAH